MTNLTHRLVTLACLGSLVAIAGCADNPAPAVAKDEAPLFEGNALLRPTDFREWQYVSTGQGMSYAGGTQQPGVLFDNVFVRRSAYESFKQSGLWPEQTIFVLELRMSSDHDSLLSAGRYQTDQLLVEASVKDSHRFENSWAYFSFYPGDDGTLPTKVERNPDGACFSCHQTHAQVDFTFGQFYPTILPIAQQLGTLVNQPASE